MVEQHTEQHTEQHSTKKPRRSFNMDDLLKVMKPGATSDGARQITLPLYNTQVEIKAFPGSRNLDAQTLDNLLIACRDLGIEFEMSLSRTRPGSEVSRINTARGAWTRVGPYTFDLIEKSRHYCQVSGGVFDITMGAVTSLWNFHTGIIPAQEELARALTHVGWQMVQTDPQTMSVRLDDPDGYIDLGGIAKGYIADAFAARLVDGGCDCACVNLGGNVLTVGCRPGGGPWRIGIRDPAVPQNLCASVAVEGKSVVTSGLYERNFTKNGVVYHHILSPQDGMPVQSDVRSATIVSTRSLDGDGYSTTLLALGVARALELVESRPEIEAFLIDDKGKIHVSAGLADSITPIGRG